MSGQLSLLGTAPDQNTFQSEKWGLLTFYPTKGNKWADTCRRCLLNAEDNEPIAECLRAPCDSEDRADGKNGYYSIHNMPTERRIQ